MKRITAIIFLSLAFAMEAAVPLEWTVETSRVQPVAFEAFHGEELSLKATFKSYARPLNLTGETFRIYWQTNGMDSAYWSTNATVTATNVVEATWMPGFDTGADAVRGFLGASGSNYRAAFTLRFRPSPGAAPNDLPLPTPILDFSKVTVLNPPWPTSGGSGNVISVNSQTGAVVLTGNDIKFGDGGWGGPNDTITDKIDGAFGFALDHILNKGNPHGVTAAQLGAVELNNTSGSQSIYGDITIGGELHAGSATFATTTSAGSFNAAIDIRKGGYPIVYGITTNGVTAHETVDLDPFASGILSQAATASQSMVGGISNQLEYIEGYMAGQRVRISVTNYYGNSSGELPRLRIEEYVTATNTIGGVEVETNYWQTVWDENSKYQQFLTNATGAVSAMTNGLYQNYYTLLQNRLNTKAPRAWGTLTSAGEAAPPGTVWHTEPHTVFAGGTEYAHKTVGSGVIGVLTSSGAAIYTDGETGRFHFTTDDRTYYFGMNIASRYELGCATDGITVTQVDGNHMVELLYNITMSGKPILYYTTNLTDSVAWEQITDSTGAAIPGASVYASWEQNPPTGSEVCNINGGASLSGFFKATVEYVGTSKFETNMMADLAGGIIATNQTTNQMQPVEPYISNGQVLWRVKQ